MVSLHVMTMTIVRAVAGVLALDIPSAVEWL